MKPTIKSCFKGCLLGGAIGDALGAPVEFDRWATIQKLHGENGVTDFLPAYGGIGKVTDDTQMSLFTAEALMRGLYQHKMKGKEMYLQANGIGLLRWHITQTDREPNAMFDGLLAEKSLYARRAPGSTCLSSIAAMLNPRQFAKNNSKGCGTVMRLAPVGLFAWSARRRDAFSMGIDFGHQTHGHPTGYLAGGFLSALVVELLNGFSLFDAVGMTLLNLKCYDDHEETYAAVSKAMGLFLDQGNPQEAIKELGEGWVAEEALAIGIYCALMATDFRHGVLMAVNHDGDTDSTGSIAGNILGILHGVEGIPTEWLEKVEMRSLIERTATDLYECPNWEKEWDWQRYACNY
ncbi:ADP-ribosylglycohydrolase family protein [Salmonella enterica subsp. enterica]|nr:ADP-ribosylglycohydrolase family protein [Salmonella enterica]EJF7575646.1 ADP-ribosylglycohydrolase family protein [Salmonella enterica subsp. enterica]